MPIETQATTVATAQSNVQTSNTVPSDESSSDAITSDFETFLLLLTAQLENQDPLNPIESQDFAVQLATFSGVEQQVKTNDLLESLTGALGASDLAQLAGWVGMEARVAAPVAFDGTPIDIAVSPDAGSDSAELIVRDAAGREVAREGVPVAGGTFSWVGQNTEGRPLEPGTYTLEVASVSQGEVTSVNAVSHYARVTEARQGANGIDLVIEGGAIVPSDAVSALREPEQP